MASSLPHSTFLGRESGHAGLEHLSLLLVVVMLAELVKREDQRLSVNAVLIPRGFHSRWENAYSAAGSPDGVLSGSVFGPENSLGTGC
jgi:hypothetical protein